MSVAEVMSEGCMGIGQAQAFTGLGRTILYELMTSGRLPYVKVGARRLIPRQALVALLSEGVAGHSSRIDETGKHGRPE